MRRLLLLLCACLFCLCCRAQPVAADPELQATFAIGVAQKGPDFGSGDHSGAMGELKLCLTGQDAGAFFEVRHAFHDANYLDRKSKIKTGLDFYLTRSTTLFAEFERSYHTGDEWAFAGVRFRLDSLFRR